MNIMNVWAVPMYQFVWDDHSKHQQELVKVAQNLEKNKYTSGVASSIIQGLYESGFDFLTVDNPGVHALSEWCKDSVWKAAAHANTKYWSPGDKLGVRIHESWCHITGDNGYHDLHQHPMSSWSGIYYIDPGSSSTEAKNGVNRFYNPNHLMYSDPGTDYISMSTSIDVPPTAGQLIVFPSWVLHSAMPYQGKHKRVVMAFNSQIVKG